MYKTNNQVWDETTHRIRENRRHTKLIQQMFGQDNLKGLTKEQRDKFWANV
jgi:hypothetical protein